MSNIRYPEVYQHLLNLLNRVVNFHLARVNSGLCYETDFEGFLTLWTALPIILGLVALLLLLWVTKTETGSRWTLPRELRSPEGFEALREKHMRVLIFVTFLLYSPVSSTLLKAFACDHLDDGKVYLRADYRIECDSVQHRNYQIYAGVMIAIYPVGIPLFYAYLLFRHREVLEDSDKRKNDSRVQPISGLWKPYTCNRFYYELIECGRRTMLTGVVVFIYPDAAAQVAVTMLIAVGFMLLSEVLAPFESRWDARVSRAGHVIVFLSMYMALLLKGDVYDEREEGQKVFAWILVAAHGCMFLAVAYEAVMMTCTLGEAEDSLPRMRSRTTLPMLHPTVQ